MARGYNSKYIDAFHEPHKLSEEEDYHNYKIGKILEGRRKPSDKEIIKKMKCHRAELSKIRE